MSVVGNLLLPVKLLEIWCQIGIIVPEECCIKLSYELQPIVLQWFGYCAKQVISTCIFHATIWRKWPNLVFQTVVFEPCYLLTYLWNLSCSIWRSCSKKKNDKTYMYAFELLTVPQCNLCFTTIHGSFWSQMKEYRKTKVRINEEVPTWASKCDHSLEAVA